MNCDRYMLILGTPSIENVPVKETVIKNENSSRIFYVK